MGDESAEGVHCGGNLSRKECARIIRRSRKFWKLPAPPQGGECLFRPICDVRIRLVRRKAVMSARAGRRRLFRRIPPNPPPPTSKLRKQTEKGGKVPPESGDFQGWSALKRVERGLPLPGNFKPVEGRFSRLTSLSSRIPRNRPQTSPARQTFRTRTRGHLFLSSDNYFSRDAFRRQECLQGGFAPHIAACSALSNALFSSNRSPDKTPTHPPEIMTSQTKPKTARLCGPRFGASGFWRVSLFPDEFPSFRFHELRQIHKRNVKPLAKSRYARRVRLVGLRSDHASALHLRQGDNERVGRASTFQNFFFRTSPWACLLPNRFWTNSVWAESGA